MNQEIIRMMHSFAFTYTKSNKQPAPPLLPTIQLLDESKGMDLSDYSSDESEEETEIDVDKSDHVLNGEEGNGHENN